MDDVEPLAVAALAITAYAVVTFFFYRTMASRDFVRLGRPDRNRRPGAVRTSVQFSANVLILPLLVVFWYVVLGLLLVAMTDPRRSAEIGDILLIAAALVAATRLCAYLSENLAQDLGKIFPWTLLGVVLVGEQLPEVDRLETSLREYDWESSAALTYGLALLALEVALRVVYRTTLFAVTHLTRSSGEGPQPEDRDEPATARPEVTPPDSPTPPEE